MSCPLAGIPVLLLREAACKAEADTGLRHCFRMQTSSLPACGIEFSKNVVSQTEHRGHVVGLRGASSAHGGAGAFSGRSRRAQRIPRAAEYLSRPMSTGQGVTELT